MTYDHKVLLTSYCSSRHSVSSSFFCWKDTRWHSQAFTPLGSFHRSCLKVFKQNLCRIPFFHHAWCWCGCRRPGLWHCEWADDRELSADSEGVLVFHKTGESLENSWDSAIYNSPPHKSEEEGEDCRKNSRSAAIVSPPLDPRGCLRTGIKIFFYALHGSVIL